MLDLFADAKPWQEPLASGAVILRRFAFDCAPSLLQAIAAIARQSPFRQMVTPGGYTMSVAMTNCGRLGWTTDQHGYLYSPFDPLTGAHTGRRCRMHSLTCTNRQRRRRAMLIFNPMPV